MRAGGGSRPGRHRPFGLGADKCHELVAAASDDGITHACVNTMSTTSEWSGTPAPGLTSPAEHVAALEAFAGWVSG